MSGTQRQQQLLKCVVVALLAVALLAALPTAAGAAVAAERISGSTRYETAVKLSQEVFGDASVIDIVVASGTGFADALSAAGLAGALNSPILLVPGSGAVPTAVLNEIDRIATEEATVWVIGGPAVIPDVVASQLEVGGVTSVERVYGANRYETSAEVARMTADAMGSNFVYAAFIASGANFPDALAVSPGAWSGGLPVLLTEPSRLTPATKSALEDIEVEECYIAGGTVAVSAATEAAIDALPDVSVARWAGADRYKTAVVIAREAKAGTWADFSYVGVASGENYPDALAGGPLAGDAGGVLLLTQSAKLSAPTGDFLDTNAGEIARCQVYGGTVAVSDAVITSINSALAP